MPAILARPVQVAYISVMSGKIQFAGTVVRTEPGGFGIVRFDHALGPRANTHGIVSSSSGTALPAFDAFRPGVRVEGMAEVDDDHELASVLNFNILEKTG
jgi:hypothetical protein